MAIRKVGIEEELMLVDPETGHLAAVSQAAVSASEAEEEVAEAVLQQIETSTEPCLDADDLLAGVRAGRRAVGEAAAAAGVRAVAMAAPVLKETREEFTPTPRYRRSRRSTARWRARRSSAACTCTSMSPPTMRPFACRRSAPWLPLLIAIAANSPYWQGVDTGQQLAVTVVEPLADCGTGRPFGDPATYREVSEQMIAWGGGLDPAMSTSTSGSRMPTRP